MTLKECLNCGRETLAASDILYPSLESEVLLRQALKLSRVQLYLDFDLELNRGQKETFWRLVKRRLKGEPTAYISGHREFYGLDFAVTSDVLIPRSETELLVEKTVSLAKNHGSPVIADIGTGCGAIAISLALELPQAKIYATDISALSLEIAQANCLKHEVTDRVSLLQGNMLESLHESVDFIVSNPPYVKEKEISDDSFEPVLALNGGADGLDLIRRLCHQLDGKLRPGGYLLLEIGQGQKKAVIDLLDSLFPLADIEVTSDLSGVDRVISAILTFI
ncbi:MAG: peptide chain release factor N(5)-glutamine methyltransferase [Dehalococcoidales bacterium]|nr:peptide chain release factor N(5)-glutamine methyltransferase [Dehalococcoidales bacterium]